MESGQLKNMIYHLPIRTNDFPQVDFPEVSVTTTARSGEFSKSGWTWTGVRGIESWASHFHDQSLLDVFINLDNTSSIHHKYIMNRPDHVQYLWVDWNRFSSRNLSRQERGAWNRTVCRCSSPGWTPNTKENRGKKWLDLQSTIWHHLRIIWESNDIIWSSVSPYFQLVRWIQRMGRHKRLGHWFCLTGQVQI